MASRTWGGVAAGGETAGGRGGAWGAAGWWAAGMGLGLALLALAARFPEHWMGLMVTLPVLAAAAGVVLYRPAWGACALVLLVYWNVSDVVTETWGFGWVLRLALGGVVGAWCLDRLLRERAVPLRWPLWRPMLAWGLVQLAAAAAAADRTVALGRLGEYAKAVVVFYLIVNLLTTPRQWRWAINALLIAVGLLALPVLVQGLTGTHNTFWGFGQMEYSELVRGQFGWRLGGALGDPNFLAMVMVAALPLAAVEVLEVRAGWLRRWLGLGVLGLGLGATLFTYSRAAALGVGLLFAVLVVWHPRRQWVVGAAVGAVLLATAIAPRSLWGRMATLVENSLAAPGQQMTDSSFRSRRHEMYTGVLMFLDHPLLGVGPGNYEVNYLHYSARAGLSGEDTVRDPHSLYVQIAAETGVAGVVVFVWLLAAALALLERARRRARRAGARNFAAWLVACQLSLVIYLLLSTFLHDAYFRHFFVLLALGALGAGLALRAGGMQQQTLTTASSYSGGGENEP
ncbi:MAG TPA: O-antigen ligase family protein [Terriglobales bacterium]